MKPCCRNYIYSPDYWEQTEGTWKRTVSHSTCPRMGPSGGPGAACPDLTMARITPPVSNFFTALAALEIFDILVSLEIPKCASESAENPLQAQGKQVSAFKNTQRQQSTSTQGSLKHHMRRSIVAPAGKTDAIPLCSRGVILKNGCFRSPRRLS